MGTPGTADFYSARGVQILALEKPPDKGDTSVDSWIRSRKIDLVINVPEGTSAKDEVTAGYLMRRAAVDLGISLLTNMK